MKKIEKILSLLREKTGTINDKELCLKLDMPYKTLDSWKSRDKIPEKRLALLARKFNFSTTMQESTIKLNEDLVYIKSYNVEFSAGAGAFIQENYEENTKIPFSSLWLSKKGLKSDNLYLVEVKGDSMEPILKNKDKVMIDKSKINPSHSVPFAVLYGEHVYIKLLQIMKKRIVLISANKIYDPIVIDLNHEYFKILGAVVWHAHYWM